MRNFFSFTLAGALGLSAAVGATSFATVDFEQIGLPKALTDLGFELAFNNSAVEPETPAFPSGNSVVRLKPTTTNLSPLDDAFHELGAAFPELGAAFGIVRTGSTFGFESGSIDATLLGSAKVIAFGTKSDGSFVGQFLKGFGAGGSGFPGSYTGPSSFAEGLTSLSFAASGDGTVSFDDIVLCEDCRIFADTSSPTPDVDENLSAVPLPASALLLLAGLGTAGVISGRRKR